MFCVCRFFFLCVCVCVCVSLHLDTRLPRPKVGEKKVLSLSFHFNLADTDTPVKWLVKNQPKLDLDFHSNFLYSVNKDTEKHTVSVIRDAVNVYVESQVEKKFLSLKFLISSKATFILQTYISSFFSFLFLLTSHHWENWLQPFFHLLCGTDTPQAATYFLFFMARFPAHIAI